MTTVTYNEELKRNSEIKLPLEERLNFLTHAMGLLLSIAGLSTLVISSSLMGDPWKIVSFSIFGASMVFLYLSSSLYHLEKDPKKKELFHVLDHTAIFFLIAGSYTPFALVTLNGLWGWILFGIVWGLTIIGTFFKLFFTGRYNLLSTIIYIIMGWVVIIAIKPLMSALPTGGLLWLFAGGVVYTTGVIFYKWKSLPYNHAIWHLFVLGGTICQFFAILFYVLPS